MHILLPLHLMAFWVVCHSQWHCMLRLWGLMLSDRDGAGVEDRCDTALTAECGAASGFSVRR